MIDLKKFREEKNISQAEICTVLGIAQPYLSAIENGKRPLNEKKFTLLYKQYGDMILPYKTTEAPILLIDEAELSLHPNIQKYLTEKLGGTLQKDNKQEMPNYDFLKPIMEERKRHDEMVAELISQNRKLIDIIDNAIKNK